MLQPLTSPGQLSPDTPSQGRLPLSPQKHPAACGSSRVSAKELGVQQDTLSLNWKARLPHTLRQRELAGERRGASFGSPKPPHRHGDSSAGRTLLPYPGADPAAAGSHQMTLEWAPNHMTARATRTFSHRPRRGTARARGDHAGLPRPAHGAGRGGAAGRGRGGGGSCRRGRGGQWRLGAGRFGPAGGWVFTLMHRDAAAVPVAINQRVLGPASLVWANATASNHFLHTMGDLVLQWHGPVARDHLRGSWGTINKHKQASESSPHAAPWSARPPGPAPVPARPPASSAARSLGLCRSVTHVPHRSQEPCPCWLPPPPATASSSSSAASSLPTSTRPLTPPPEEGTHNQAGLRTGALGGSRWARGGEGGEGAALPPPSVTRRARRPALRPAWGRRPGEARPACAPPRPQAPAYLQAFPSPPHRSAAAPRCAEVGDQRSRLLGAAGVSLPEGSGARAGLDVGPLSPRGPGARVGGERPRAGRGPESLRGVSWHGEPTWRPVPRELARG